MTKRQRSDGGRMVCVCILGGRGGAEQEKHESKETVTVFLVTCSKLLNGHEREADERESFSQDFAFVLRCRL